MMSPQNLKKIRDNTKRTLFCCSLILLLFFVGCSTTGSYLIENEDYLEKLFSSADAFTGIEHTSMNISIPTAYGDIPAHPDDPGSVTRKVNLKSGSYTSMGVGIEVSPLPFHSTQNFKLGYKAVFPSSANEIRKGLSDMEWYQSGAFAGTYSRVKLPTVINSFRASWRQPLIEKWPAGLFVEPGLSYDFWKVKVQGGWDRNYEEEPLLNDSLKSQTLNPFVRVGVNISGINDNWSMGINLFWKSEKINGNTPHGDVDIKGNTYGLEVLIRF